MLGDGKDDLTTQLDSRRQPRASNASASSISVSRRTAAPVSNGPLPQPPGLGRQVFILSTN